MQRPVRSWAYLRVSGDEQARDGTSLDAQRERCIGWFRSLGFPDPTIRVEVESAGEEKIERRVELHRIIKDARPGDLIAVAVLDRWSRDIVFGVKSVRELVRAGVGWYAIQEQIDASTPEGDSQLGLRMWLAEEERRRIRDRTTRRAQGLREQGLWALGAVPYGYRRGDRKARKHLHLEVVPEQAAIVIEWHKRLVRGESLRAVSAWLRAEHPGAPRGCAHLDRLTTSRIYLGELRVAGRWVRGQHDPIVPLDLWERTQAALAERRRMGRRPGAGDALLRGLLVCELCGRRVGESAGRGVGGQRPGKLYRYYVCAGKRAGRACRAHYVRQDTLDAAAEEAVLARLGELREALLARAVKHRDHKPANDPAAARARVQARLSRAVSAYTDGAITAEELRAQRRRLEEELAAIDRKAAEAEREERGRDPGRRAELAKALSNARRVWRALPPEERREQIRILAHGVALDAEGGLRWKWRTAEELAADE